MTIAAEYCSAVANSYATPGVATAVQPATQATESPAADFGNVCNDKLYSEDAYYYRTEEFDTSDGAVDRICELIMNFVNENEREDLENEKDL